MILVYPNTARPAQLLRTPGKWTGFFTNHIHLFCYFLVWFASVNYDTKRRMLANEVLQQFLFYSLFFWGGVGRGAHLSSLYSLEFLVIKKISDHSESVTHNVHTLSGLCSPKEETPLNV